MPVLSDYCRARIISTRTMSTPLCYTGHVDTWTAIGVGYAVYNLAVLGWLLWAYNRAAP